jgi:hypothetical protein
MQNVADYSEQQAGSYEIRSLFSSSSSTLKVKVKIKVKVKGLPVCADAVSERLQTNEMSCLPTDNRTLHLLHNRKLSGQRSVWAVRMEPPLKHAARTSLAEL